MLPAAAARRGRPAAARLERIGRPRAARLTAPVLACLIGLGSRMEERIDQEERRRRLREQPVISVEPSEEACIVRLGGELDLYNAPRIREALLEVCRDAPPRIVLDFSEVEFIDSTALGALLEARATLPNKRSMLIASPGIETRRALQVSGLDRHLPVVDSVEDALAADV
jgi:anti-anti-sigma factor